MSGCCHLESTKNQDLLGLSKFITVSGARAKGPDDIISTAFLRISKAFLRKSRACGPPPRQAQGAGLIANNFMFNAFISGFNFVILAYPISIVVALLIAVFLFWRAGRHEFMDSEELFDVSLVSLAGALLFGRLFEFIGSADRFQWSISRLVFVNAYGGLDFYGVLVGVFVFVWLFLKRRVIKAFKVLDLMAAPFVFAQAIVAAGSFVLPTMKAKEISLAFLKFMGAKYPLALIYLLGYFFIFIVLKRLQAKKRHAGFFACFYVVAISILDLVIYPLRDDSAKIGQLPYHLVMPPVFLIVGVVAWHILAKRSLRDDFKSFLAFALLTLFRIKRSIKDINEAGTLSRAIVLAPYFLVRSIFRLCLLLVKELRLAIVELLMVLGIKDDKYKWLKSKN